MKGDPIRGVAGLQSQPVARDMAVDAGALRLLSRLVADEEERRVFMQMLGLVETHDAPPRRATSGAVMDETYSEKRREADRRRNRARTPEQKAARRERDAERRRLRDLAREGAL